MKRNYTYKIVGNLIGKIWQPTEYNCSKSICIQFSRTVKGKLYPTDAVYPSLKEAVNSLTADGDFRSCKFDANSSLCVFYHTGTKQVTRWFPLDMFPSISELVSDEVAEDEMAT